MRGGFGQPSHHLLTRLCRGLPTVRQQQQWSYHLSFSGAWQCRRRHSSSTTSSHIPDITGTVGASDTGIKNTSASADLDISAIAEEMLARRPQIHHDVMHAGNSHLLTIALSEFLFFSEEHDIDIERRQPWRHSISTMGSYGTGYPGSTDSLLPAGHHLVYFPLLLRGPELCTDGTDPYHSPASYKKYSKYRINATGTATGEEAWEEEEEGEEGGGNGAAALTRRMWAGGSIHGFDYLALDGQPAVCVERIVGCRGTASGKVFVDVLREYMSRTDHKRWLEADPDLPGVLTEHRTLVFMREPSLEEKKLSLEQKPRVVKAPTKPDYTTTITPTPTLLFHYSALSYNAHRIHLDQSYCREVEGHADLLVHGPLTLTLMLTFLRSRLATHVSPGGEIVPEEFIDRIDYRNLAPLYVNRPLRVCLALRRTRPTPTPTPPGAGAGAGAGADGGQIGKKGKKNKPDKAEARVEEGRNQWDVWVENEDGGMCVRGTAYTVRHRRVYDEIYKGTKWFGPEKEPDRNVGLKKRGTRKFVQ